jgi:hypothetical protein
MGTQLSFTPKELLPTFFLQGSAGFISSKNTKSLYGILYV